MSIASTNNPQNRVNQAMIRHISREVAVRGLRSDAFVALLPLLTSTPNFRIVCAR